MRNIFTAITALLSLTVWSQPKPGDIKTINTVSKPNPDTRIIFRCTATRCSEKALLVLDGVHVENDDINKIDPNNIESISVLKSAEASALYGSLALNGVIIITTKSASLRKFIIKDFLDGKTIPGASVKFKSQDKTDSLLLIANDSGFIITNKLKAGVDYNIEVSSIGFNSYNSHYKSSSINKEQIIFLEKKINTLSEVIMVAYESRTIRCGGCTLCTVIRTYSPGRDTLKQTSIPKIYPNPIHRGSNFNLDLTSDVPSTYMIRIISLSGTIIHQQQIGNSKWKSVTLASDSKWAGGTYIVQLITKEGKQCGQQKLIIQ